MELSWSIFKKFVDSKNLKVQYVEDDELYFVWTSDTTLVVTCRILKDNGSDQSEFESNYKNDANDGYDALGVATSQFDTDGATIVRPKAAKKGWSFYALPPEITTSTLGGTLYCKDLEGEDISGISCKIYDEDDDEITEAGLAGINLLTCVKTVLDIELPYDFELIGGSLRIHSNPAQDLRIWIIGAPDIPAIYGGSKEFASGVNLKFLAPDNSFDVDGRVTKYITYNATTHSSKIRILMRHGAGLTVNMQVLLHLYRQ